MIGRKYASTIEAGLTLQSELLRKYLRESPGMAKLYRQPSDFE